MSKITVFSITLLFFLLTITNCITPNIPPDASSFKAMTENPNQKNAKKTTFKGKKSIEAHSYYGTNEDGSSDIFKNIKKVVYGKKAQCPKLF